MNGPLYIENGPQNGKGGGGYIELHAHSAYSFLDGASQPDELAARAVELGYGAYALTDHDGLHGAMEFAHAATGLGLKPIIGAELSLSDGTHITLLARTKAGYKNLCRLITLAHAGTRPGDGDARSQTDPQLNSSHLTSHANGLICLSGCARDGAVGGRIERGDPLAAEAAARLLLDAFGHEEFLIELQRPFARHDRSRNAHLAEMARRLGVKTVATGNVHAHSRERAALQDAFVALRNGGTLDDTEAARRGNSAHVMVAPSEMARRFAEHPEAVAQTAEVAARIEFDITRDLGYRYPGASDPGANRKLAELCGHRFPERYGNNREAAGRLDEELKIIAGLGLSGFFLLHQDLLELAREVAIEVRGPSAARAVLPPGRGRGSSVSSLVCYLTGLSHVDPLKADLFLGRFLNEDLTALPDIDLDFPRDIRKALIPRIHQRYGTERSALVCAFPTYRTRSAIRDLGKALGLPNGEVERLVRTIDRGDGDTLGERIENSLGGNAACYRESGIKARDDLLASPRWRALIRLADQIHRLPRHMSQHSGGMVISTEPLIDICPVVPAAMQGRQMVQWDKDSCADAGFLKIDLLGLGMLSAVERCVDLVHGARGETLDLSRIPLDDKKVFKQIQAAETTGVFQIESRAQMQMLVRSLPESLDDLVIQVALVRPGPILGKAVHPYLERKAALRENPNYKIPYDHPSLEPILKETFGGIVFQDQVIEVAMELSGFSPGEAEGLRRAMTKKRSEAAMRMYEDAFVDGAVARGVDRKVAQEIFIQVRGFSGFGFPKAHSAAFGLLAYQTAWLRCHYGPEFVCALINEQPMGFYPPDALLHEAQHRGFKVLPIEINQSDAECTVEPDGEGGQAIRLGLGYVRGVREQDVRLLVQECERGGPFSSIGELAGRVGIARSALDKLAWAGACDQICAGGRRQALWQLGTVALAHTVPGGNATVRPSVPLAGQGADQALRQTSPKRLSGQEHLGSRAKGIAGTQLALPLEPETAPLFKPLGDWELLLADYASTGVTITNHPMSLLRDDLGPKVATSGDLAAVGDRATIQIAGLVIARQRPATAKGVVFVLLEDETGTANVILKPEVYERFRVTVRSEPLLLVTGKVDRRSGATNIVATNIKGLHGPPIAEAGSGASVHELPVGPANPGAIEEGIDAAQIRAVAPVGINFGRRGR